MYCPLVHLTTTYPVRFPLPPFYVVLVLASCPFSFPTGSHTPPFPLHFYVRFPTVVTTTAPFTRCHLHVPLTFPRSPHFTTRSLVCYHHGSLRLRRYALPRFSSATVYSYHTPPPRTFLHSSPHYVRFTHILRFYYWFHVYPRIFRLRSLRTHVTFTLPVRFVTHTFRFPRCHTTVRFPSGCCYVGLVYVCPLRLPRCWVTFPTPPLHTHTHTGYFPTVRFGLFVPFPTTHTLPLHTPLHTTTRVLIYYTLIYSVTHHTTHHGLLFVPDSSHTHVVCYVGWLPTHCSHHTLHTTSFTGQLPHYGRLRLLRFV